MRETRVRSLGWEDPLEKAVATHSSTLAWKIPWTEETDRLQSVGSRRVGHDWRTSLSLFTFPPYKEGTFVEVMEFQLSYFKSWKMMLWKCCTQYASKFGKLSRGHRTGKGQFSFQFQRKAFNSNAKECSNYCTIALILHAIKVILKILQDRLQQYVNPELPDVQAGVRKGRGTTDQIANIHWIIEEASEFQKKTSVSALLTMPKPLTVWITINCRKFWKRWEYQTTWPASWEIVCRSGSNS